MKKKIKWYTNKQYPNTEKRTKILVDFGNNNYEVLIWNPKNPEYLSGTKNIIISTFEEIKRWTSLEQMAKLL